MPTHKNVTLRDGSVLTENVTPSQEPRTPGLRSRGFMTSFRKENYVSLTSISPLPVRTESSTVASPTGIRCRWTSTSTPGPLTLASPDRVSTSTMTSCWSSSARTSPLVVFRRAPLWTTTPSRLTSPLKLRTSASFRTVLRTETSPEYDLTMPRTVEFRMSTSPDLLTMSPSTRHSSSVTSPDVDCAEMRCVSVPASISPDTQRTTTSPLRLLTVMSPETVLSSHGMSAGTSSSTGCPSLPNPRLNEKPWNSPAVSLDSTSTTSPF